VAGDLPPPHHASGAALLVCTLIALVVAPGPRADAQTVGHWRITYTYSGTTTSLKNGQGTQAPWPENGPINAPTRDFGNGDQITVAMSGTITATLTWVDQNNNPITDPPPPADVYVLQRSSSSWSYGGEEVAATVTDEGVSTSLPSGQEASVTRPPNWSHSVTARKISKVNGSSGTISLPVTLDAHLTFTCTAGFSGSATAQVNYGVVEVAPADCYDFDGYPPSPPGEPPGPTGSVPAAKEAAIKLEGPLFDGTGYYVGPPRKNKDDVPERAYTNHTAQHALEQLKKTAIFYVFGHGGEQYHSSQTFWNNNQWGAIVQTTNAREYLVQQGMPYRNVVVLDERDEHGRLIIPTNAFRKVLLAVYQGCYTAEIAGQGSPVMGTRNHGARCVLGFRGLIRSHEKDAQGNVVVKGAEEWAEAFWWFLIQGQTVSSAAYLACDGIPGYKGLTDRQHLGLCDETRIHPSRYGY